MVGDHAGGDQLTTGDVVTTTNAATETPAPESPPSSLMLADPTEVVGDSEIPELATGRVAVAELHRLIEIRWEHLVEVDQALVLISQIGRSGGTLLARLLDGHPELHGHPYELHIGHPDKIHWPEIDPSNDPQKLFRSLREPQNERLFWRGHHKKGLPLAGRKPSADAVRPFLYLPSLHQRLFHHMIERRFVIETSRDVLDCYMTALFNAWLDYGGLYLRPKRWVVAYTPLLGWDPQRQAYFADYPDGRLISILRDAESWWASARLYDPVTYGDLDFSLEMWRHSTRQMIAAQRERLESNAIVRFADLVGSTSKTMRSVGRFLGIRFDKILTTPTFNAMPVPANSSFGDSGPGVVPAAAERAAVLSEAERRRIRQASTRLLRQASELALPA